jgi:hypothetical protein
MPPPDPKAALVNSLSADAIIGADPLFFKPAAIDALIDAAPHIAAGDPGLLDHLTDTLRETLADLEAL